MSSVRFNKLVKSDKGFSMAEVLIAMVLFVSSIVGLSMMLLSGSAAVTRGSMESQAAELAQRKVEEVKSLQFYTPWTGANQDIDDFYWAFDGDTPRSNAEQLNNPTVEDYGSIAHRGQFKRTTAIQYQTITNGQLSPAAMNDYWVPKSKTSNSVVSPQFDVPKDTSNQRVRALMIEVRVYYRFGNLAQENVYVTRGIVSDLMVTSGNTAVIVIKAISPATGMINSDTNLTFDITVKSEGLQDDFNNGTANVAASLWYAGRTDIPCKEYEAGGVTAQVLNNGTLIRCHFNLSDHTYFDVEEQETKSVIVRPGPYNLAVYWKNRGWEDTSFRECFTVLTAPPVYDSLSNYNWGHKGQSSRRLTVNGSNLHGVTITLKKGTTLIPGAVSSNDGSTLVATFNLSSISGEDEYWDIEITTIGGTVVSDTNAKRLYVNPRSVITRISDTSSPNYYRWAHSGQTARRIRIEGDYLYGYEDAIPTNEKLMKYGGYTTTGEAVWVSGPTGDEASPLNQSLVLTFNPSTASVGYNATNSYWTVHLKNYGGVAESTTDTGRVLFNPTPTITQVSPTSVGNYYDWAHSDQTARNVRVEGTYLYAFGVSGAEAQMNYNSYATSKAGITTAPALNDESDTDPVTFSFNPNSADSGSYWTTSNTRWDVHLKNYGGTADSDTDAKRVLMNPPPTITRITPTEGGSSPSYFDWTYWSKGATPVRIEGTNLYALGATTVGAERKLKYSTYTLEGTVTTDAGADYVVNSSVATIISFNPSSVPALVENVRNTRWDVYLKNYGGIAQSGGDSSRVWMNPPPQVTSVSGLVSGYRKQGTVATVTVNGNYFQNNAMLYLSNNWDGSWPPPAGVLVKCSGGVTNNAGTQITGIAENLDKANFYDWTGGSLGSLPGTSPLLNMTSYRIWVQNQNSDLASQFWGTYTVTLQNATPAITGVTSVCYNDWDVPVTITGNYFDTTASNMAVSFVDTYGLTGTKSIGGSYGTGQSITGLNMNTIGLLDQAYNITVTDSETGKSSNYNYTVALPASDAIQIFGTNITFAGSGQQAFWNNSGCSGSTTDNPNWAQDNGDRQYKIIAKRMRYSQYWDFFVSGLTGGGDKKFWASVGTDYDRANKWVRTTGTCHYDECPLWNRDVDVKGSNTGDSGYCVNWGARLKLYP